MAICFVTSNSNKLNEFLQIISSFHNPNKFYSLSIELSEYQGEKDQIAIGKCRVALERLQIPVLVEDTSLCFNAMNGLPGPYVKWFIDKLKPDKFVRILDGFQDKTAYAQCTLAYGEPGIKEIILFTGRLDGRIVEPRGPSNFGWCSCFEPKGFDQTLAEMSNQTRNSISHNSRAIISFCDYLDNK
jgi:inosine triphosphate pyrophosphatase